MPEELFGLPTHILLLHLVVVLLPIVAVAAVAVAVSSRARHRWGIATVCVTFVVSLFVPLTSQAGEALAARLPNDAMIARHASVGKQLVIWTAVFGLSLFAMVAIDVIRRASVGPDQLTAAETWASAHVARRWRGGAPAWTTVGFRAAQVMAIATAIGTTIMVILAGHSGARAVWSHYPNLR